MLSKIYQNNVHLELEINSEDKQSSYTYVDQEKKSNKSRQKNGSKITPLRIELTQPVGVRIRFGFLLIFSFIALLDSPTLCRALFFVFSKSAFYPVVTFLATQSNES